MSVNSKILFFLFLVGQGFNGFAQTPSSTQLIAFQKLIRLELIETTELLQNYKKINHREQSLTYYLINYSEFLEVLISGDLAIWETYKTNANKRLNKISACKNDEFYYYAKWNIHLQNAILRINFGDNIRAGINLFSFYRTLQEAIRERPDNYFNLQGKAFYEIFFGLIPDDYLWAFRLTGFRGDFNEGIKYLNLYAGFVGKTPGFADEAKIFQLIVALQLEGTPQKVVDVIEKHGNLFTLNPPSMFIYTLALIKAGQSEKSIELLKNYKPGPSEYEIAFMNLLLGEVMLYKGVSGSDKYFEIFLQKYEGSNFRKVAWQKLAMYNLLENNKEKLQYCLKNLHSDGSLMIDPDRQAFSELNYIPDYHPALLNSRLRFDGGYYAMALNELSGFTPKGNRQELEYFYRLGRIYHKTGNELNAILYYQEVIDTDKGSGYYFAAYSALQLAELYAAQDSKLKAEEYFRLALNLNRGEYKRTIDFLARNGLRKL